MWQIVIPIAGLIVLGDTLYRKRSDEGRRGLKGAPEASGASSV